MADEPWPELANDPKVGVTSVEEGLNEQFQNQKHTVFGWKTMTMNQLADYNQWLERGLFPHPLLWNYWNEPPQRSFLVSNYGPPITEPIFALTGEELWAKPSRQGTTN